MGKRHSLKKILLVTLAIVICAGGITIWHQNRENTASTYCKSNCSYGVFLGIDSIEMKKLEPYNTVVIEPAAFEKKHIDQLHRQGKTVYGYLNVGAIEKHRPYYKRFQKLTLGSYENWPEERWMDVSRKSWQQFVVRELGEAYGEKGIDGFFIDNADVYYQYKKKEIYQGLYNILSDLKKQNIPIIINGGDVFVTKVLEENAGDMFDAVNQETVFTAIDFEKKIYGTQQKEMTAYLKGYLKKVKKAGKQVYLLEYGADETLARRIDGYCKDNHFIWYNAAGLDLL